MSAGVPRREDDVEALVHLHLREQEAAVDPRAILEGVRARRAAETSRGSRPAGGRSVGRAFARWAAAAAAAVLICGMFWTFRQDSARAEAVRLVQEAREVAGPRADRSYRIQIDLEPGMAEHSPFLAALAAFDSRLRTRSDRFWIEATQEARAWAWGRDERRHVWIAPSAEVGLDFAPEEVPEPIDVALDLLSFDLDDVLHRLATDFDATVLRDGADLPPGVRRIRGTPKADRPRPRLRSITVEIDERTKVVRRVVLSRVWQGRPAAEVSFTLDRAEAEPDAAYRLATHLDPDAQVFGPERRIRRRRELAHFFGTLILKGG